MWIALGIIIFIIALISAILFLPIHLLFKTGSDESPSLFVRLLFIKIDVIKFISKKSKKEKKRSKKFIKSIENTDSKKTISQRITDIIETIKTIIDIAKGIAGRIVIKKLKIYVVTADTDAADAALDYGKLCAVIYPSVSFLQSYVKVREKGLDISLHCDFDASSPVFLVNTDITINLFNIITVFLKNAFKNSK